MVKTRMLFYNGLVPFTHPNNPGGANNTWYLAPGPTANTTYPLVSPYQSWPILPQTLNLNWFNDVQYWQTIAGYNDIGSTLYGDYWSRYISSLYNKYSRRLTAKFILNNIDLNEFSFDDTIFINGTYYRPEKIIDVEIGAYTEVQVQLLTANDYTPAVTLNETLTNFSAVGTNTGCSNSNGTITITTDGTPNFSWELSNGVTGSFTANVGLAPYTFDITPVAPGTTTVTVTDFLGRNANATVTIPAGPNSLPASTHVSVDPTDCTAPCNGSITTTPSGGTGPYIITWSGTGTTIGGNNFAPTNLCPGTYNWYIEDSLGCQSATYTQKLACNSTNKVWLFGQDINCNYLGVKTYLVDTGVASPNVNDIFTLNDTSTGLDIAGCWRPISEQIGAIPTHTTSATWIDCFTCQGIGGAYWKVDDCQNPGTTITVKDNGTTPSLNTIWDLNGGPANTCWEVTGTGNGANWSGYTLDTLYADCPTCLPVPANIYSAENQNQGNFNSFCPVNAKPYIIYSPFTTDPTQVPINSTVYSDPAFQYPWFGASSNAKWYATSSTNVSGATLISMRIDAFGKVISKNICP